MPVNSVHPQKNTRSSKIVKLKSDKFAEAPLVRKLKNAILIKIQEKYPAVRDYLACAASHRAPDQSVLNAIGAVSDEVGAYATSMVEHRRSMSKASKTQLREAVLDEIFGFGPLGVLLRKPDVGNIYVEGATRVFVEKILPHGERRIEQLRLPFRDENHVLDVIHRIVTPLGLELNENTPLISGTLPNGSVVYASLPPASVHGPTLSVLCKELTQLKVLPDWHVCYRQGDTPPTFRNEGAPDLRDFCLCVRVPTDSWSVNLSQRLSARSFRGKTVRFSGATKMENLETSSTNNDVEFAKEKRPYRTIRAWAGRQNQQKCWSAEAQEDVATEVVGDGWRYFACTLAVPSEALDLELILSLKSGFISKVKNLSFEVVSNEKKEGSGSRLRLPKNLSLHLPT